MNEWSGEKKEEEAIVDTQVSIVDESGNHKSKKTKSN